MELKKVTYMLVSKAVEKTEDTPRVAEGFLWEDERIVVGELPSAEDVKDEAGFRKAREEAKLKLSQVELRVYTVPFQVA